MKGALVVAFVLAGCVESGKVVCGDGRVCPAGYQCDDVAHRCISPDQLTACAGLAPNDPCVISGAPGVCDDGACEPLVCGDGLVSGNEQCDGENLDNKTCKDLRFYDDAGLACTSACTFDTSACTGFCGDGIVNGGEQCDGAPPLAACIDVGLDAGPLGCNQSCAASLDDCGRLSWHLEATGVLGEAIAGTSTSDQWVVGAAGGIAHYNGVVWQTEPPITSSDLYGVAADAVDDVWAVGDGVVLHRDSSGWQIVADAPVAQYTAVWAASPTAVFCATRDHQVQWWNGLTWQALGTLDTVAVVTITGTSASDLWITKFDASLWHWDGASWTQPPLVGKFSSVAALAPDAVWVAGATTTFSAGLIEYWNGQVWTTTSTPNITYSTIVAEGPHDLWACIGGGGLAHFDGTSWVADMFTIDGEPPVGLAMFGTGEVVAVSDHGPVYRFTGQEYAEFTGSPGGSNSAIWSSTGEDIFLANGTVIYRFDGLGFVSTFTPGDLIEQLWGRSATDVWAVSQAHLYHYNGTWTTVTTGVAGTYSHIWDAAANDAWLFTNTGVYHVGSATAHLPSVTTWSSVSGTGTGDVWAVGGQPTSALYHWNGLAWSAFAGVPISQPIAVGVIGSDVFLTAADGMVAHWNGTTWTMASLLTVHPLTMVAAIAADDVVVASDLELFHFDGTRWSPIRPAHDTSQSVNTIVGLTSPSAGHIHMLLLNSYVEDLVRTRPWVCRAHETNCNDGIDDDCDGLIDQQDSDCP